MGGEESDDSSRTRGSCAAAGLSDSAVRQLTVDQRASVSGSTRSRRSRGADPWGPSPLHQLLSWPRAAFRLRLGTPPTRESVGARLLLRGRACSPVPVEKEHSRNRAANICIAAALCHFFRPEHRGTRQRQPYQCRQTFCVRPQSRAAGRAQAASSQVARVFSHQFLRKYWDGGGRRGGGLWGPR